MVTLQDNELEFRFPEVHLDARLEISFQRTLRVPDDGRRHFLPPSLGSFPLTPVDDYARSVPPKWVKHGGVFLPMYQAEAMWMNFSGDYPMAVKIAAGKINAVTGEEWTNELTEDPQDYVVIPAQPWLDGFCVEKDIVRQFVAMPLGEGFTAEEQLTGKAEHGGVQIVAYPMKAAEYARRRARPRYESGVAYCPAPMADRMDMGLAPGGSIRQEIYDDEYGFHVWDQSVRSRCFVHIVNSAHYFKLCGTHPPHRPPSAKDYTKAGLPWFDFYDQERKSLKGAKKLAGLKSVAEKDPKAVDDDSLPPVVVKDLSDRVFLNEVREGEF